MSDLRDDPDAQDPGPATAASRLTGAGAKTAAAASGAGAAASSSDDQLAGMGSAPTSAEMVISCAAPARNSAARRHGQLGRNGSKIEVATSGAARAAAIAARSLVR